MKTPITHNSFNSISPKANQGLSQGLSKFLSSQFSSMVSKHVPQAAKATQVSAGPSSFFKSLMQRRMSNFSKALTQSTPTAQKTAAQQNHKPVNVAQLVHKLSPSRLQAFRTRIQRNLAGISVQPKVAKTEQVASAPKNYGTGEIQSFVQQASKEYNVPVALINAVIKQESAFNPKAVSHCGAQGLMQLMPGTAKDMGCDDSFDAKKNVMGGTKYLSGLLKKYKGNVTLALAGYNAGPGNVAKYGNKVPPFKETQNYVKKVNQNYKTNLSQTKSYNKVQA